MNWKDCRRVKLCSRAGIHTGILVFCAAARLISNAQEVRLAEGAEVYKRMSLEELMEQDVTTASRKPEKLAHVASSTHIITADEIRRTGVTSIPEALRYSPGLAVARVNTHTWAISSRGFNSTSANKLQILMDGRRLYSPLFSGVFWDAQDTLIEDIARIEVIRGPGASMWGANAVNGVINIITKPAEQTQGALLLGGAGTEERGFGGIRYGGQISENAHYRVYGKYFDRDESALPSGADADDEWRQGQAGFRVDWGANLRNSFTLQGDAYMGEKREFVTLPLLTGPVRQFDDTELHGANLLGRWHHTFSERADMTTQVYYDHTYRDIPQWFTEERHTIDLDWQNHLALGERNEFLWGLNYTVTADDILNTYGVSWAGGNRSIQVFSAFLQDEITLVPERLRWMLGSRFEHNDYTGFEIQPNTRLAYTPTERQTIWAAVARAVRTPSRVDTDLRLRAPLGPDATGAAPPVGSHVLFLGNPEFSSEEVITYELGYRVRPFSRLSFDFTAFYSEYDELRSLEFGPRTPTGAIVVQNALLANNLEGITYGGGVSAKADLAEWWSVSAGYSFLEVQLQTRPGSADPNSERNQEGSDPTHQVFALSTWDLPHRVALDAALRFVDELPALAVPAYTSLDLQIRWRPLEQLELAIVGQNLLDDQRPEFSSPLRTEIQRSVYGKVTWRF